jgi:phosphoserine phosphatase
MSEIVLVNVSGRDRPGLTSSLTAILAQYDVNVLDIGQAVIHDTLSLGLLIEIPEESEPSPVLKEMVFCAHELDVDIRFTPISDDDYEHWVHQQRRRRYIITALGPRITARQISAIAGIVSDNGLNIDDISRLSERVPLHQPDRPQRFCIDLTVSGPAENLPDIRARFMQVSAELGFDIAFQEDSVYRRNRRLVALDMDSTLVPYEIIDELAAAAGVGDKVAEITAATMRGELDFAESFTRRVALLKGLQESALERIASELTLMQGAERLMATLKTLGYKIAVLSGGFTYFGRLLQERLGIDYLHANELGIEDGIVTGEVAGEIVDGRRKADLLRDIAGKEGISLEQVIAVGDGANDLPMLNLAGLGIAFHAKPVVREGAEHSLSTIGLDGILYLMGIRDRDLMS